MYDCPIDKSIELKAEGCQSIVRLPALPELSAIIMQPAHLEYIVDHVFLPPKLRGDHTSITTAVNHSLVTVILGIAKEYHSKLPGQVERSRWEPMTKMLAILQKSTDSGGLSSSLIADSIDAMIGGG